MATQDDRFEQMTAVIRTLENLETARLQGSHREVTLASCASKSISISSIVKLLVSWYRCRYVAFGL